MRHTPQVTPERLALRLREAGPERAGMGLGKMCPYLVAAALPLMRRKDAADILRMARPAVAARVGHSPLNAPRARPERYRPAPQISPQQARKASRVPPRTFRMFPDCPPSVSFLTRSLKPPECSPTVPPWRSLSVLRMAATAGVTLRLSQSSGGR